MKRPWLGVIGVVAVIAAAIVGFVLWEEGRASRRLSAEAPTIGFVATPTQWRDSGAERDVQGHTLTFSYLDAASNAYTRTMEQVTWYDPAKQYKVCYDPGNPDDWKLYESTHECGS